MTIAVRDIVAFSDARTHLSRLVDEVRLGGEKIITKNGEPAVALIDAKRLDHYHRLEQDRVHLLLLEEVEKGLADVEAGRTSDAMQTLQDLQMQRSKVKRTTQKAS
ncbi:MAG: type II toxin-antitoxin system Phd/YefM family antitoxin [Burkholderiales bacterium]|jgi:prevent-host-death family protein|nr:type II toxin-antitoxin system Phd/YefM family antitoxin [Burkholderiales bacterium]